MTRSVTRLLAGLLVLSATVLTGGVLAGAAVNAPPPAPTTGTATAGQANDTAPAPGDVVSGFVDSQGASVGEAVAVETYRERLAAAETPTERARVVATALDRVERRVGSLEARTARLRAARANGTLDADAYAVRVAPLVARAGALADLLDWSRRAADGIDAETRREAGADSERVRRLAERVDDVTAAGEGVLGEDGLDRTFYRQVATVAAAYNEDAGRYDLGVLGSHIDGERINLHVHRRDGGTEVVSFRMSERSRIRDLRAGPHPDATLRLTVAEPTARRVLDADDPAAEASAAFVDGEIEIDGLGLYNAIKWTVANAVIGVFRALAGLVGALLSVLP